MTDKSPPTSGIRTFEDWERAPRPRRRILRRLVLVAIAAGVIWFVPWVFILKLGQPVTVTRWTKSKGEVQAKVGPGEKGWTPLRVVSRHVIHAFVVAEDDRFFEHFGIDLVEVKQSIEKNVARKRYARGASTITQQVVKVTLLNPEKTLIRKSREAVGAVLLDAIMSKDEILEWYINLVELGDNVYGVEAAARHYFQTKPELLTVAQAAHLALVLPSPNRWSRGLRKRELTVFGHRRFAAIVTGMKRRGFITDQQWRLALATGDFGRPIPGYDKYIVDEETSPMAPLPDATGEDGESEAETSTEATQEQPTPSPGTIAQASPSRSLENAPSPSAPAASLLPDFGPQDGGAP